MVQGRGIQVKHSDFTELRTERSIFREAELEKEEESTQRKNSSQCAIRNVLSRCLVNTLSSRKKKKDGKK